MSMLAIQQVSTNHNMRKSIFFILAIISTLSFSSCSSCSDTQNTESAKENEFDSIPLAEDFSFMGCEIQGTIDEFCNELRQKTNFDEVNSHWFRIDSVPCRIFRGTIDIPELRKPMSGTVGVWYFPESKQVFGIDVLPDSIIDHEKIIRTFHYSYNDNINEFNNDIYFRKKSLRGIIIVRRIWYNSYRETNRYYLGSTFGKGDYCGIFYFGPRDYPCNKERHNVERIMAKTDSTLLFEIRHSL